MWAFENPAFACLEIDYEVENRDIQALYEPHGRQSDLARVSGFETYFRLCFVFQQNSLTISTKVTKNVDWHIKQLQNNL